MKRLTQEDFVARSIEKHGDKYDYSKVVLVESHQKVCIICKECGREFWQTPSNHLFGNGCPYCRGKHGWDKRGRITTEEFIRRAKEIHGDRYDYSKVVYTNAITKVCIICPIHGEFWQTPNSHLSGKGCKKCACSDSENNLVFGIGLNDTNYKINNNNIIKPSYSLWIHMLRRCYRPDSKTKSYKDCSVCEDWLTYSHFDKWFSEHSNEYGDNYQIDKDILVKGNKVYSPDTCCFVPQEINLLLINRKSCRGSLPLGVQKQTRSDNFMVRLNRYGKAKYVGTFNTIEEAFAAYKQEKEAYIKEVAQRYFDENKITKRVYDALMKYEVEITD